MFKKCCKKRKLDETTIENIQSNAVVSKKFIQEQEPDQTTFDSCVIGSSMIKNINKLDLFENSKFKNTYFKSISGGLIKHVHEDLKNMSHELKNCKLFIITVGSNDCDSLNQIDKVIGDYLDLVEYLRDTYSSETCIILNKLIPRLKTRYTKLDDFDKRRLCFNNFIQNSLCTMFSSSLFVVEHERFEIRENEIDATNNNILNEFLSDGVHLSIQKGVKLYVEDIKNVLNKIV